jgi:carbonic anhydrase
MTKIQGKFATAVNCMDGRVQLPVIAYLKERFGIDYVDMITEPGPVKYLADKNDSARIESIKNRVKVSVEAHDSKLIAVVGHDRCAGNPVDRKIQEEQIKKSIKLARSWGFEAEIIGLFVNWRWMVEEL